MVSRTYCYFLCILVGLLFAQQQLLQAQSFMPTISHPKNEFNRTSIDGKRIEADRFPKDALNRAREFKRTDSTYYVGWMYEGQYLADNAADYLGYYNAIASLRKALDLLEYDYKKYLKVRSSDFFEYYPVYNLHTDYTNIADALVDCYSNTNQPDSSYAIIRRVQKNNLQNEGRLHTYNSLAWLIHRNRFYTSEKYAFLKNSIAENEAMANALLDSSFMKIKKDSRLNAEFFGSGYADYMNYAVYHYKAMLYGYNLDIDSAEYYFNKMKGTPYFSHNNYANLNLTRGNFKLAEKHYASAADQDDDSKRLKEYQYYQGIIDVYKGSVSASAEQLNELVSHTGSTPGFGWYNIALARAMNYGGNITSSKKYINKAKDFKEIHIGTTLGESHYNTSLKLVKYHQLNNEFEFLKFEHKNWWYNIPVLFKLAKVYLQILNLKYEIVNELSINPEREAVIYKLFATESTVAWDEITSLLDGFSTNYFKNKYDQYLEIDTRSKVKSYYRYMLARLALRQNNYQQADDLLNELLSENLDEEYERLFLGRIYLAKMEIAEEMDDEASKLAYYLKLYAVYPQLIPFANIQPQIAINIDKTKNSDLWKALKKYKIDWVVQDDTELPSLQVTTNTNGESIINVNKSNAFDNTIVDFVLNEDPDVAVKEIIDALFALVPDQE